MLHLTLVASISALGAGVPVLSQESGDAAGEASEGGALQADADEGEDAPLFEEPEASGKADEAGPLTRRALLPEVEDILGRFDCLACHAPEAPLRAALDRQVAPDLKGVSRRTSAAWMIDFLLNPRAVRPGTAHPHQLIGIPDNLRDSVALDLTHFLHKIDGGNRAAFPVETAVIADLERGRRLFHEVGCAVCHGPQESAEDLEYSLVDLTQMDPLDEDLLAYDGPLPNGVLELDFHPLPQDLPRKQTLSELATFLLDPVDQRPAGFCPSMSLNAGEARAISSYLLRSSAQRADGSFERRPGMLAQVYHGDFKGRDGVEKMLGSETVKEAVVRSVDEGFALALETRDNQFGIRYSGLIDAPEEGEYTFHLASDDGSWLSIGGRPLIKNGNVHPFREKSATVTLEPGLHALSVEYFEAGGDQQLRLEWTPAGGERGPIPESAFSHWPLEYRVQGAEGLPLEETAFALEPARAARGAQAFDKLGCAACHTGIRDDDMQAAEAQSLEQLASLRPGVLICLRKGRRFEFEPETVGRLLSAFVDPEGVAADAADPERAVERIMARRRCYSCHRRDEIGGVHPAMMPFFTGDENAELGDQGRFPPTLSQVGRKFRPSVLEAALRGEEKVRPYLNTRMP
ncbi:MAG: PA14 domain-containing protein, partial [Planctomycetota bacterium]